MNDCPQTILEKCPHCPQLFENACHWNYKNIQRHVESCKTSRGSFKFNTELM